MRIFIALTADDRAMCLSGSLDFVRNWAADWVDLSGANRTPVRIIEAERGEGGRKACIIRARTDRINRRFVLAEHAL